MTDRPDLPPLPPNDPARDGFDLKYFQARAAAIEQYERGGYQGQQREVKGKTQIQLWYRDLAITRKQKQESESKESKDNERQSDQRPTDE